MAMTDPAESVKDILVSAGVGTFAVATGWGIFIGPLPSNNDTVIVVNQAPAGMDPYPHLLIDFPNIQVLVRGKAGGYQAARDKCGEVADALNGLTDTTVNSDVWQSVRQIGNIGFLGIDDNKRPLFSLNFTAIVLPASGTYRNPIT